MIFEWDDSKRLANLLARPPAMKPKPTSRKYFSDVDRISRMRDEDIVIDEDAPEFTDEMFARAVLRVGWKPVTRKTLLSLRVDSDVLAWFRAQGPGYQSRMNALLRAYMEASLKAGEADED